ncbi:MAG TPA: exodeoxyribonuclease VII large subunit [Bacilli bacterium]|jgi:exodeoxyribonuclease VII large subunit|nr:exodeoxyribonuclease VII large subunit [Bacilli bacterium]HPA98855.1 exodeoxyribonuclease VII large subunit [Bacilli bacterium]HPV55241.1 exodeoxyribonuclease VII large subunit [Bacilli bacterium]HPX82910.1 exodeoxyribonuclease VII large subunit [Bacilli bacterium]HQB79681.1 exodeoxyribonuclease VII large subunit [Bacilli bacterium]
MEEVKYLTVTAVSSYLEYLINQDPYLGKLIVLGEVSSSRLSKGHLYFNLKDEGAVVRCVMFKNYLDQNNLDIKDGMKVLVYGKLNLYKQGGYYSIMCFKIDEFGKGDLYKAFLLLKEKLEKEGLFKEEYKKPIPRINERIGVITALTAEAFNDIKITITRRFPSAVIYLYPSLVQGDSAPKALIKAINKANQDNLVDVIILARGGGSQEDLNCFNNEELAYAIFNSKIPIVTGIGHEGDFTIADFVADKRAATPTAAATLVTIDSSELKEQLNKVELRLNSIIARQITNLEHQYNVLKNNYYLKNYSEVLDLKIKDLNNLYFKLNQLSPLNKINIGFSELESYKKRLSLIKPLEKIDALKDKVVDYNLKINKLLENKINEFNRQINNNIDRLIIINPLNLMKKGYALAYQEGNLIKSVTELDQAKPLEVKFSDGKVETKISKIERNNNGS